MIFPLPSHMFSGSGIKMSSCSCQSNTPLMAVSEMVRCYFAVVPVRLSFTSTYVVTTGIPPFRSPGNLPQYADCQARTGCCQHQVCWPFWGCKQILSGTGSTSLFEQCSLRRIPLCSGYTARPRINLYGGADFLAVTIPAFI